MKEKVYIETSVISYLCSWPSRDLIVAANQEVTREWWERDRMRYDLFVSQFVTAEIRAGDDNAAAKRVRAVEDILTWNCAHIANPHWMKKISDIVVAHGFRMPVVCNPQALLEGEPE